MIIKKLVKAVTPSPIWEYLRYKKAKHKALRAIREYMEITGVEAFRGFHLLDHEEYWGKSKVFNGEQYYSQAGQDYFLDSAVFCRKRGGFFLDIGGNNPVNINNTYFFEKSRGWKGLAFEPLAEQREKWKDSRTTECLPFALGSKTGEAEFCEYDAHYMSGFSDDVEFSGTVKARYKVPVRRLADVLEEHGVAHVDFVSLDVEGAEIEVLSGIDFSRVDIECFTIENNKGHEREIRIRKFMKDAGYKLIARLWLDDVYVKVRSAE